MTYSKDSGNTDRPEGYGSDSSSVKDIPRMMESVDSPGIPQPDELASYDSIRSTLPKENRVNISGVADRRKAIHSQEDFTDGEVTGDLDDIPTNIEDPEELVHKENEPHLPEDSTDMSGEHASESHDSVKLLKKKPASLHKRITSTTEVVQQIPAEEEHNTRLELPSENSDTEVKTGPLTGEMFEGKYKMGPLLGEGGMGVVYRATHVMMRKEVAIKLLHPHLMRHSDIVERFRREAESLARLDHPNVIKVLDFGRSDEGIFYLVMDFVPGIALDKYLRQKKEGRLHWREASAIVVEILRGLQAAHNEGIIHRDLKPENILLQPDTLLDDSPISLKILDFGIARLRESDGPASNLTQSGMIFGTPGYLSPEQAQGRLDITPAVDIYATGIIYFLLVTGRLPFTGSNHMEVLQKHIGERPPVPKKLVPEIPRGISNIILKALRKNPERRFSSAEHMREEIERYLNTSTTMLSSVTMIPSSLQDFLFYTKTGHILVLTAFLFMLGYIFATFILDTDSTNQEELIAPTPKLLEIKKMEEQKELEEVTNTSRKPLSQLSLDELYLREKGLSSLIKKHPEDGRLLRQIETVHTEIVKREKKKIWDLLGTVGVDKRSLNGVLRKLIKLKDWNRRDGELRLQLAIVYERMRQHKKAQTNLRDALLADVKLKDSPKAQNMIKHYLKSGKYYIANGAMDLVELLYDKNEGKKLRFLKEVLSEALPHSSKITLGMDPDIAYKLYKFLLAHKALTDFDYRIFWRTMLRTSSNCTVRQEAASWFVSNAQPEDLSFLRREMRRQYFYDSRGIKVKTHCYRKILKQAIDRLKPSKKRRISRNHS